MTAFPGSPKLLKGAIVRLDVANLVMSMEVSHSYPGQAQVAGRLEWEGVST